jgi:hypothetical protein
LIGAILPHKFREFRDFVERLRAMNASVEIKDF